MNKSDIRLILEENARRTLAESYSPDPIEGDMTETGRSPYSFEGKIYYLPQDMLADPKLALIGCYRDFARLRFRYDFPFWAATCVVINDKLTSRDIPFRLNRPQRRLVRMLEEDRRAGRPLRLIMLKARQWGGSSLVQIYFAWIQIIHCRGWNSLICAHVKDTASTIRGMYSKLLSHYPEEYWEEEPKPEFRPFERMSNTRIIPGRDCKVTVCSSENQEATRGQDYALAHLSEVAFWKDSPLHNPADLLRSVTSGIASKPLSFIAMESTANGVGNFFHSEWLRANTPGKSDKRPFFVGWQEIEMNRMEVEDPEQFISSLDEYECELWDLRGCTLEAIRWYREKRLGFPDHRSMMAEFPTTPEEAFLTTSRGVFSSEDVERLRADCRLIPLRGEITASEFGDAGVPQRPRFQPSDDGNFNLWAAPKVDHEYIVCVDIGGRGRNSDYSVICVLDRHTEEPIFKQPSHAGRVCPTTSPAEGIVPELSPAATSPAEQTTEPISQAERIDQKTASEGDSRPEVVGQWRGHIDHDLLALKAEAIARFFNMALLVVESNSWESNSEGEGRYLLSRLMHRYPNLYYRRSDESHTSRLPGFHTNMRTKPAIIANLVACVRDTAYIERDPGTCDELLQYEALPEGGYAARRGSHDDRLMTRAIALYIHTHLLQTGTFHMTPRLYQTLLTHTR